MKRILAISSCLALVLSMAGCSPGVLGERAARARAGQATPDPTVLGFRIGAPLRLPTCKPDAIWHERTCFFDEQRLDDEDRVGIAQAELPDRRETDWVHVRLDPEGRLQHMRVDLRRNDALSSLVAKYGPADVRREDGVGKTLYQWNFRDMRVQMVDDGHIAKITAMTAAERRRLDAERAAAAARKRKL